MKAVNGTPKAMMFGFTAVNAGQRGVVYDPEVVAVSTNGGFRITPPVSKVLNVQHGDYVMFISNIDTIDVEINNQNPTFIKFCEDQGLTFGTPEAAIAIHNEYDMWLVAKGIVEMDARGNVRKTAVRLTKEDRLSFVKAHYEEMLEAAHNSGDQKMIDAITRDGVTVEEIEDILCTAVVADEVDKIKGSKVASPTGLTGYGTTLTFTDSNVWNQLKHDLGKEATSVNRVFKVNVDEVITVNISNGYEEVPVRALVIKEYVDKAPSRDAKKAKNNEE